MRIEVDFGNGIVRIRVVVGEREYVTIGPRNDPASLICVLVLQMIRGGEESSNVAAAVGEVLKRLSNR